MTGADPFARARSEAGGTAAERLHALFEIAWAKRLEDAPELATFFGIAGHGDRWSDLSPAAVADRRARAARPLEVLRTIDREALDEHDQLSWDVFEQQARSEGEAARFPNDHLHVVGPLGHPAAEAAQTLAAMPTGTASDLADVLERLRRLPAQLEQASALLEEALTLGVTPPAVTLRDVPSSIAAHLAPDGDPRSSPLLAGLRGRVGAPSPEEDDVLAEAAAIVDEHVDPALRRFLGHVTDVYLPGARASVGLAALPDGADWYAERVRTYTTTDLAPEEIHELGLAEVARVGAAMDDVMAGTGFDGDRMAFAELLRTDARFRFDDEDDLLRSYRDIAKRVDQHVAGLFRTMPRLPFAVVPVPAESASSAPMAFYLPGSIEQGRAGQFFANTSHLETRVSWNMESVCIHEAVPGHHFQIALAQELGHLPAFRANGLFTAYVEGWGLYCEGLGKELGLYTDPYQHFGALDAEMLRSVRLVLDTGLHALGWDRRRAIDYFLEHSVTPEQEVVVEVDRYITLPGQALAYKVGERRITALREAAAAAAGEAFDIRDFHDEVLRHGALPLDLLGALVARRFDSSAPA
ncbi:MAG: DUF885 domain-containing protein [Actinomycetota bacterium]|nr:DUF885 domain-containing protein [Actinomycetota bacterium]